VAALSERIVIVPLYDTLGPNATAYIIDHAELTCVLIERSKLKSLLSGRGVSGLMHTAVMFEDATPMEKHEAMQVCMY
jgi:long-chain acyl-CoA synthetase